MKKKYLVRMAAGAVLLSSLLGTGMSIANADTTSATSAQRIAEIAKEVSSLSQTVTTLSVIDAGRKAIIVNVKNQLAGIEIKVKALLAMPTITAEEKAAFSQAVAAIGVEVQALVPIVTALAKIQDQEMAVIATVRNRLSLLAAELVVM